MSKEIDAKLAVIQHMNATLSKVVEVKVRLTLAGEDKLAKQIETLRKALVKQIEKLHSLLELPADAKSITQSLITSNAERLGVRPRLLAN